MSDPSRRSARLLAAVAGGLAVALGSAVGEATPGDAPLVPKPGGLNAHVLAVIKTYPTDGSHGYWWPKGSSWAGTTRDLAYQGATIAHGDGQGRCYCCGLTFEVFFRAWERWCESKRQPFRIGDLDVSGVKRLRRLWYGSDSSVGEENVRRTLQHALVSLGLGEVVPHDRARRGDFVQLWRSSGSGHSVVFLRWLRNSRRQIVGIRYWSSQPSTDGIGTREESLEGHGGGVLLDQTWVARPGRPR